MSAPGVLAPDSPERQAVVAAVLTWYDTHARDLPWRAPGVGAWAVMVSEFMLQQTPVERVREPWRQWMARWPSPDALAASSPGDAVRAWGRLGYPRRALRLHQAARAIAEDFDGQVPADRESLLSLPGVGAYTAAAIASFAYGRREVVLDTNVRRVLHRVAWGQAQPPAAQTRAERDLGAAFLPDEPARAARWAVASMELGALVCVARTPRCEACPVATDCAWRAAGYPAGDGPPRRAQGYDGTDRQCRGALLAVLRSSDVPVPTAELEAAWGDPAQRDRCLASLVTDGLATAAADGWALPGG
ncbi:MAG: mutY [Friedmanniella sp.]|nr:mutY [Friedmanniella sp.]